MDHHMPSVPDEGLHEEKRGRKVTVRIRTWALMTDMTWLVSKVLSQVRGGAVISGNVKDIQKAFIHLVSDRHLRTLIWPREI